GTTEVTQGQWRKIMGNNPSRFKGDNRPVEKVSWNDCQKFIRKLNRKEGTSKYRLPTEAEWEYACRAGTMTPFYTGDCISTDQANYDGNYPMPGCSKGRDREKTVDVASFSPNKWGLYDMHGNVWEWCEDRYGYYPSGHVTDPEGPSGGSHRVYRGGGWSYGDRYCRSAFRNGGRPGYGYGDGGLGLRLDRAR
ncbi:MAG: formylglycine-generating enzyme family protein, partial [Thermodesulfobacteriota bacterium]|nr:formylglycine-generating enzyme family protein [Thermodesulfobacteriota bacterium]